MELKTVKKIVAVVAVVMVGFIIVASAVVPDDDIPANVAFSKFIPQNSTEIIQSSSEPSPAPADVPEVVENEAKQPVTTSKDNGMSLTESNIEKYVFQFTNEERVKAGLPPLVYDPELSAIAKAHAKDMAARDYYEHETPEGKDPTDRAIEAGYQVHKDLEGGYVLEGVSENIHKLGYGLNGNVFIPKYDSEKIARKLVDDWMGSKGHRENIMRDIHTNIGIGVAFDGDKWYYGVQDFW